MPQKGHALIRHSIASLTTLVTLATLTSLSFTPQVWADTINLHYYRSGASETIIAPFTAPSTSTVNNYFGQVEIIVDGAGWSNGDRINDAFYQVPSGAANRGYYRLNLSWDGANLLPLVNNRNINIFTSFIEDQGAVTSGTAPAYNANHVYHFVVDVPTSPTRLQFGVSDGLFFDNGGQFRIQAFQLAPIPEPETWALMLAGLGLLPWRTRAMQRKNALRST